MNAAEREIKKVLDEPDLGQRIYTSMENLSKCVLTILETGGTAGWTSLIKGQDDKPLFPTKDEQGAFEKAIAPFVGQIQEFFGKPVTQEGGDPLSSNPPPTSSNPLENKNKKPVNIKLANTKPVNTKPASVEPKNAEVERDKPSSDATGIDSMFHKVVDGFRKTDESIKGYSGIIKFEEGYDTGKKDPKPFAALKAVPYVGPIISEIPVPARTIVLIVYTILDAARLMMAIAPTDVPFIRKVMSLVLAVADFLKGDWKRAVLSFAGFFGQNYVIMGVFGKTFLNIFAMISPDLQDTMIFGSLDVIKSLIAGILLFIFQTVALEQMRTPVIDAFEQIKAIVEKNNEVLTGHSFNPHPDYLIPSMTDIQNLQAVVANPNLVCSEQFIQIVDSNLKKSGGKDNYIMTTVLELLRVPLTDDERNRKCGKDWKKTFTARTITSEQSEKPETLEPAVLPPQSVQETQATHSAHSDSNKASLQPVEAPLSIDVHVHTEPESVAKTVAPASTSASSVVAPASVAPVSSVSTPASNTASSAPAPTPASTPASNTASTEAVPAPAPTAPTPAPTVNAPTPASNTASVPTP